MIIKSITELDSNISIDSFSCGNDALDLYLKRYARQNDINNIGKTFVCLEDNNVIGFVTLCAASIDFKELPKDYLKIPKYPIPAIRLARLAVSKEHQNKHIGQELLKFALKRIAVISVNAGVKLVVVDAKEESKGFYEKYGFLPLPTKPLTYVITLETIIKAIVNQ